MWKNFGKKNCVVFRDQQRSKNLPMSHCADFKGSIKRAKDFTLALGRDSLN